MAPRPTRPPPQHIANPALGDKTLQDPSLRVFYPVLYITDITGGASTAGDWQHGGTGTTFIDDIFGTWSTATLVGTTFHRHPPASQESLGPGHRLDTPPAGTTTFDEGYGAEVRWNASNLGVQVGHTYRFQILTHDGDQNKDGGDAGEQCVNLTIPLPPTITTNASAGVDLGGSITDTAHLTGGANPTGTITFKAYGPDDATCANPAASRPTRPSPERAITPPRPSPRRPRLPIDGGLYSGVQGDPNNPGPEGVQCRQRGGRNARRRDARIPPLPRR